MQVATGNVVQGNTTTGNTNTGISIFSSAGTNVIKSNTALDNGIADLTDDNASCGWNTWRSNTFAVDLVAAASDGGPGVGCIR